LISIILYESANPNWIKDGFAETILVVPRSISDATAISFVTVYCNTLPSLTVSASYITSIVHNCEPAQCSIPLYVFDV
jgi:hypothetical protein